MSQQLPEVPLRCLCQVTEWYEKGSDKPLSTELFIPQWCLLFPGQGIVNILSRAGILTTFLKYLVPIVHDMNDARAIEIITQAKAEEPR
jgi:hypothetical protein